jgi:PAS domain S-box-containing protein
MKAEVFRKNIESNGLIIICLGAALVYWIFESIFTGVFGMRLFMIVLFVVYGFFTQYLINSERNLQNELKTAYDGLEEQVKIRTADLIKVNDELKMSERLFQTLSRISPVGIFRVDAQGDFVYVNERWCEIAGLPADNALGDGWVKAMHPDDRENYYAEWYKSVREKRPFNAEFRFQHPDGISIWVLGQSAAEINHAGATTGYVGTVTDITERKQKFDRLQKALRATIKAITLVVEVRDPYTAGHQVRVSEIAQAIAGEMELPPDRQDSLRLASVIHDIGKIVVPAEILSKPSKLRDAEFSLIRIHPEAGHEILKEIDLSGNVDQIIFQHHERVNGSGYPQGLSGQDILLEARILAVADVVEAMASHRPYRPTIGIEHALEEISKNRGSLYDPDVVDACLRLFHEKSYKITA